jgi:hypothetical protein
MHEKLRLLALAPLPDSFLEEWNRMTFTRMAAAAFVVMLIGIFIYAVIAGVAWAGPTYLRDSRFAGSTMMHAAGKVIEVGPGKNFELEMSSGKKMNFLCGTDCHASLGHLERHMKEKANTDVYYQVGADGTFVAMDAD